MLWRVHAFLQLGEYLARVRRRERHHLRGGGVERTFMRATVASRHGLTVQPPLQAMTATTLTSQPVAHAPPPARVVCVAVGSDCPHDHPVGRFEFGRFELVTCLRTGRHAWIAARSASNSGDIMWSASSYTSMRSVRQSTRASPASCISCRRRPGVPTCLVDQMVRVSQGVRFATYHRLIQVSTRTQGTIHATGSSHETIPQRQ